MENAPLSSWISPILPSGLAFDHSASNSGLAASMGPVWLVRTFPGELERERGEVRGKQRRGKTTRILRDIR